MKDLLRHSHPEDTTELLSSYLDDAVDLIERQHVERLLRSCEACAAELAALRGLRALLRALPAPMPRRSFTLDPATARQPRRLFPIFRFASLAAAVLLLLVVGVDALNFDGAGGGVATSATGSGAQLAQPEAAAPPEALSLRSAGTPAPAANDAGSQAAGAAAAAATEAAAAPAAASGAMKATAAAAAAAAPEESAEASSADLQPGIASEDPAGATWTAVAESMPEETTAAAGEAERVLPAPAPAPAGGAGEAGGTESLKPYGAEDAQTDAGPQEVERAPIRPIRVAQYVLGAVVIGLGLATWRLRRLGL